MAIDDVVNAPVAEKVDAPALNSGANLRGGSNPSRGTKQPSKATSAHRLAYAKDYQKAKRRGLTIHQYRDKVAKGEIE